MSSNKSKAIFSNIDSQVFRDKFSKKNKSIHKVDFNVVGLRCIACVNKINNLYNKDDNVKLNANLPNQTISIYYDPDQNKLSEVINRINSEGFRPLSFIEPSSFNNKLSLIRIAISFFCFGNIMMFAFAEYFSANDIQPEIKLLFRSISAALTLIVITFCAAPFYKQAIVSIKSKMFNIYIPISIAIVLAYFLSLHASIYNRDSIYFDSIAAIVTLLLLGQFLQQKIIEKSESLIARLKSHHNQFVLKKTNDSFAPCMTENVAINDHLRLLPGDVSPVNAKAINSYAVINSELINGEPNDLIIKKGELIPSGAIIKNHAIEALALEDGLLGFIHMTKNQSFELYEKKGRMAEKVYLISKVFGVTLTLIVCAIFFSYLPYDLEKAITYSIAGLLVACPCALGLAIPLTYTTIVARALKEGIIFRSEHALEKICESKDFYFDKTGTLTTGELKVVGVKTHNDAHPFIVNHFSRVLFLLSKLKDHSHHQTTVSISNWATLELKNIETELNSNTHLINVKEDLGNGLFFSYNLDGEILNLFLGKASNSNHESEMLATFSTVLKINEKIAVEFDITDTLRPEAPSVIQKLKKINSNIYLLSGDRSDRCSEIARSLEISESNTVAQATPTKKLQVIKEFLNKNRIPTMIGNGFNDSLAVANASIGVSLGNAPTHTQKVSDIVLLNNNLEQLCTAIKFSRQSKLTIFQAFTFAGFYNIIALSLAASGYLSPVAAAILMPISSATITYISIKRRKLS